MVNNLVSAIIPVYNTERYLRECLDSLCKQTYSNLEIILIDDGSTDASPAICDEYSVKDSRISVIHNQNAGVSAARNTGLDKAKGKYIAFVDSDDWVEPEYIESLLEALTNYDADAAGFPVTLAWKNRFKQAGKRISDKKILTGKEMTEYALIGNLSIYSVLYKTEYIKGLWFRTDLHFGEDIIFMSEYALKCKLVVYLEKTLYYYRQRCNSAVKTYNISRLNDGESITKYWIDFGSSMHVNIEYIYMYIYGYLYYLLAFAKCDRQYQDFYKKYIKFFWPHLGEVPYDTKTKIKKAVAMVMPAFMYKFAKKSASVLKQLTGRKKYVLYD